MTNINDLTPQQLETLKKYREKKAALAKLKQEQSVNNGAQPKNDPSVVNQTSNFANAIKSQEKIEHEEQAKARKGKKTKTDTNPYMNAKMSFRDLYSKLKFQNIILISLFSISMLVIVACLAYIIADSSRSKYIPFAFAVDSHGVVLGMGPAEQVPIENENVKMAFICDFITDSRSVTLDVNLLRRFTNKVYAFLRQQDPAWKKMSDYYSSDATSPFRRAETVLVDVNITSVISQSPNTFEVTWIETTRDRKGIKVMPDQTMRALVTYIQDKPSSDGQQQLLNPFGIYVTDFSWGKVRG